VVTPGITCGATSKRISAAALPARRIRSISSPVRISDDKTATGSPETAYGGKGVPGGTDLVGLSRPGRTGGSERGASSGDRVFRFATRRGYRHPSWVDSGAVCHHLGSIDQRMNLLTLSTTHTGRSLSSTSIVIFITVWYPPVTSVTSSISAPALTLEPTSSGAGNRTLLVP